MERSWEDASPPDLVDEKKDAMLEDVVAFDQEFVVDFVLAACFPSMEVASCNVKLVVGVRHRSSSKVQTPDIVTDFAFQLTTLSSSSSSFGRWWALANVSKVLAKELSFASICGDWFASGRFES